MQALHFTYGIGSFVAPLICEPFLSTESIHSGSHGVPSGVPSETTISTTPSTELLLETIGSNTTSLEILNPIDPIDFLIYIPYAIAGAITILSSLVVLFLYYYKKYEPPTKAAKTVEYQSGGK